MNNIVEFPKQYSTPEEALEMAKGWDFETVMIAGHTKEGGTDEGGLIFSTTKSDEQAAKDMLHMAELLRWSALKKLRLI